MGEDQGMEYQLKRENCSVCETVFEGTKEQPIDLDLSLPDYCPDIERILKCRVCPSVTGKSVSGDMLEVDGSALISLYYLDSKKRAIRLCEHTVPFSCSFGLKSAATDPVASVRLKTEYINCRALSPRRVDIHGAFSVCVSVRSRSEQEYFSSIEGEDIEQKKQKLTISRLCASVQQQFSITEVLDIGQGKGFPESILRSELSVRMDSSKALSDKIMINGEAVLRMLYVTELESGAQDTMTFNIPFSQVLDAGGVNESTINEVGLEVMNYDVSLKSEFDENSTLVTLDAKISASIIARQDEEIEVATDAYSTEYELSLDSKQYQFSRLAESISQRFTVVGEVSTGDNEISQIIDLWCDSISSMVSVENEGASVRGKAVCSIFALDPDGTPFYIERPLDINYTADINAGPESSVKADVRVAGLTFRITGDNSVEIRAELQLLGAVYESASVRGIISAEYSEDKLRGKDRAAALTLYYAEEGERLWDIACAYCTSAEAVRLENNMSGDTVAARGMILIPMQ